MACPGKENQSLIKAAFAALLAVASVYTAILSGNGVAAGSVLFVAALCAVPKYPFVVLCAFIALNVLDSEFVWFGGTSVLAPIAVLVAVSCALGSLSSRISRRHTFGLAVVCLYALLLWALGSCVWAYDAGEAMNRISVFSLGMVVYLSTTYLVRTPERLRLAVQCLALSSLMVVPVIVFSGSEAFTSYVGGYRSAYAEYFSKPVAYLGSAILPGTFYALMLTLGSKTWSQYAASGILLAVLVGCGLFLLARTYIIGLLAGTVVLFLVLGAAQRRQLLARTLPVAIALLTLVLRFMPSMFFGRIMAALTLSDRASGRLDIWLANLQMAADHPLLGVGFGNSPSLVGRYLATTDRFVPDTVITSHSVPLQLLSELGLLGLVLYVAYVFCLLRRFWVCLPHVPTEHRSMCAVIGASATAVLVYTLVEPFLWQKLFWIVMGLTSAIPVLCGSKRETGLSDRQMNLSTTQKGQGTDACALSADGVKGDGVGRL